MAIIKKNLIGELSGSLSDVIFRKRNGKIVAYSKPSNQKISNSKKSIDARKRFATTVTLAKKINSNILLSEIWKISNISATNAYQKIIKINSKFSEPDCISVQNKLVPDSRFNAFFTFKYDNNFLYTDLDCKKLNKVLLKFPIIHYLIYAVTISNDKYIEMINIELPDLRYLNSYSAEINLDRIINSKTLSAVALTTITANPSKTKKLIWTSSVGFKII